MADVPAAPLLLNGLPKSGTHLLAKVVSLLPGMRRSEVSLTPAGFGVRLGADAPGGVEVGIGREIRVAPDALAAALAHVPGGHFAVGHVPWSERMQQMLAERGWRSLTLLRDPRDVVVSHAQYAAEKPSHPFHAMSNAERILRSIEGFEQHGARPLRLLDIATRVRRILPWRDWSSNCTLHFEQLVGARGGGCDRTQRAQIDDVARHLGLVLDAERRERVADAAFGGAATFRQGRIGRWREAFSAAHVRAFKRIAGSLLVELGYESDDAW